MDTITNLIESIKADFAADPHSFHNSVMNNTVDSVVLVSAEKNLESWAQEFIVVFEVVGAEQELFFSYFWKSITISRRAFSRLRECKKVVAITYVPI